MLSARIPAAFLALSIASLAAPVRIVLVGDSTVNPEGGWGPGFAASFSGSPVEIINLAKNGRSSKSFRDEGLWKPALSPKPDYVLIQFGHNDCPGKGPDRETNPQTTYRANLTRYIEEVRAAGGKPVLVTSIVRRNFDDQGQLRQDCLLPFVEEVRRLGPSLNVPVMDLYKLTWDQTVALGPRRADSLGTTGPDGKPDRTHLGPAGQLEIGVLAAREFARVMPAMAAQIHPVVAWKNAMDQQPAWYGTPDAVRLADSVIAWQNKNGGWIKNTDMTLPPFKPGNDETTIDNGATWTQMQFLARVHAATKQQRFAEAFRRGFRYLLAAQYPNGGWPQFYPLRQGYYTHITFNDDAMVGVLNTLRADYPFLTDAERKQARDAVARGIDVILKSQIRVNGKPTVWCAQHDEVTLAPAPARTFEPASFSGGESVGLVRFLMSIEKPSPEITAAIEGATAWLRIHTIRGIRVERRPDPSSPKGYDTIAVADSKAAPVWARFYDLKTAEPIFTGRDATPRRTLAEIEYERRNGYAYYTDRPQKLLDEDYPRWKTRTQHVMLFGDSTALGRPFAKDPSVIRFGNRYLMYYSIPGGLDMQGWSVGIAESRDLINWKRVGQVLPEPGAAHEAKGLAAPYARVIDGEVHLFYQTYGNLRNDAICHATSKDGLTFRRNPTNPIFHPTGNWTAGRAIDAEVVEFKGRYFLYAATRDPDMKVQMLTGAVAEKGKGFNRDAWKQIGNASILKPELPWEQDCIEAPAIVVRGDVMYMFYAGAYNNAPQQIGVARSRDGLTWERVSSEPLFRVGEPGSWNASESGHPGAFVDNDGQTYLFFQGNADNGRTWFLSHVKVNWTGADGPPSIAPTTQPIN